MTDKTRITKLSDTEFHFEDTLKCPLEKMKQLKRFEHEGQCYKVLKVTETFAISGYHSYMVYAKLEHALVSKILKFNPIRQRRSVK